MFENGQYVRKPNPAFAKWKPLPLTGRVKLKATVVMTSVSLMGQWEDEVRLHAPPPFGASVVLLTAAFGGVAFYAAKFAIGRDQSKIASMRGPDAVGTGKGKERSAKKRR